MRFGNGGRRPIVALLATVLAVFALGSCGGDAEPSPIDDGGKQEEKDDSTPTPTPTSTPTPTADLATELEATANEFYEKLDQAYETHETEPFRKMGGRGCTACSNYLDSIETYEKRGQHNERVTYTFEDFKIVDDNKINPVATFTLSTTKGRVVDDNGDTVEELQPQTVAVRMEFEKVEGKWIVAEQGID